MGRWPSGAQDRLQQAAIELFAERGYGRTTVAEIAIRAGLTERSFYNHFADKREALFPGEELVIDGLVEALATAAPEQSPLDVVARTLAANGEWFDRRRDAAALRRQVIDRTADLQEREAAKMAALSAAIAGALRRRGGSDIAASVTAATAVAAFQVASSRWLDDPAGRPFRQHLSTVLDELRRTAGGWVTLTGFEAADVSSTSTNPSGPVEP